MDRLMNFAKDMASEYQDAQSRRDDDNQQSYDDDQSRGRQDNRQQQGYDDDDSGQQSYRRQDQDDDNQGSRDYDDRGSQRAGMKMSFVYGVLISFYRTTSPGTRSTWRFFWRGRCCAAKCWGFRQLGNVFQRYSTYHVGKSFWSN